MAKHKPGVKMPELNHDPLSEGRPEHRRRSGLVVALDHSGDKSFEARVKPECDHLYPGVDPKTWYEVVQEGEYTDDMEGLWIQVSDWVTYVLAKHFDLQARPRVH